MVICPSSYKIKKEKLQKGVIVHWVIRDTRSNWDVQIVEKMPNSSDQLHCICKYNLYVLERSDDFPSKKIFF